MLNSLNMIAVDDDTPKCPDPSHDDLWSAQAKRYQCLCLEQLGPAGPKSGAKVAGSIWSDQISTKRAYAAQGSAGFMSKSR